MRERPWPRCHFCNTNPETETLEEAMKSLRACNNCSVDIQMGGQWSGYGKEAIVVLFRRFGYDATNRAWMGEKVEGE